MPSSVSAARKAPKTRTFRAIDPALQRSLPQYARIDSRVRLTHRGAVTEDMFRQMMRAHEDKVSFASLRRQQKQTYSDRYYLLERQYYQLCDEFHERMLRQCSATGSSRADGRGSAVGSGSSRAAGGGGSHAGGSRATGSGSGAQQSKITGLFKRLEELQRQGRGQTQVQ